MVYKIMVIVKDNPPEETLKDKFKKIFHEDDNTTIILFSNEKIYVVSENSKCVSVYYSFN